VRLCPIAYRRLTVAPQTGNLTKRAVRHGLYHFFFTLFCVVLLRAREMLTGTGLRLDKYEIM
jgi:hypothetical protein